MQKQKGEECRFHQLQRWIVEGTLQPGEKLMDAEIAEELGMIEDT
ncbi:DNA-binding GntR family transcriptional regulator [Brevibacillus aydinogluensis]|nr:GntR family transcriptional regulator [Brevibacillus sp. NL20B1]MDT3417369.1 DNA-binding GntR family transcriptional regulator [Brevibacillus aydinogluensis]NNV04029.1 GntR family transcriptional regulator [Brevibacillus sp. MCWH]REK63096.1 MAG: hypothetical protein DF221_11840 [Brevibacillus sp.]UFJ60974.1 GntR family transcriptional regulator [Anoxybacillus sediminis]